MPVRLDQTAGDFEQQFATLLGAKRETSVEVGDAVEKIINDVRMRGDKALVDLTNKFDHLDLAKLASRSPRTKLTQLIKRHLANSSMR